MNESPFYGNQTSAFDETSFVGNDVVSLAQEQEGAEKSQTLAANGEIVGAEKAYENITQDENGGMFDTTVSSDSELKRRLYINRELAETFRNTFFTDEAGAKERKEYFEKNPQYAYLTDSETLIHKGAQEFFAGKLYVDNVANGDTYDACMNLINTQKDAKKAHEWLVKFNECKDENEAIELAGSFIKDINLEHEESIKKFNKEWEEVYSKEVISFLRGEETSTKFNEMLGRQPDIVEKLNNVRPKVQAVWDILKQYTQSVEVGEVLDATEGLDKSWDAAWNAKVRERAKELKKEWFDSVHFRWTEVPSNDDFLQQAAHELRKSLPTSKYLDEDVLKNVSSIVFDGSKYEKDTAAALQLLLHAQAEKEQPIMVSPISSFYHGASGAMTSIANFFSTLGEEHEKRTESVGYTPYLMGGAPVSVGVMDAEKLAETDRINKFVALMRDAEKSANTMSSKADVLSRLVGDVSYLSGEMLPMLTATTLTGGVGGGLAASTGVGFGSLYPQIAEQNIEDAYLQNYNNPFAVGIVQSIPDTGVEVLFNAAFGNPLGRKLAGAVGARIMKLPVAGRAFANLKGIGLIRAVTGYGLEVGGEIAEDAIADFTNDKVFGLLQAAGVDIGTPEFNAIQSLQANLEPRQLATISAYAALLGFGGMKADFNKARDFLGTREDLRSALISDKEARRLANEKESLDEEVAKVWNSNLSNEEKANKIVELQSKFDNDLRSTFAREVINGDPVELEKRAKAEDKETLSQCEKEIYAASGARDLVLEKAGVSVSRNDNGTYNVTLQTETEKGEPTEKTYNWTEEQLNSYVSLQANKNIRESLAEFQNLLQGDAAVDKAASDPRNTAIRFLNIGTSATQQLIELVPEMMNAKTFTLDMLKKISEFSATELNNLVNGGIDATLAAAQESSLIQGVSVGTLVGLYQASEQRVKEAIGTTEGKSLGISKVRGSQQFGAISLKGIDGKQVVAFFKGNLSFSDFAEDLWEAKLKNQVAKGNISWGKLYTQLKDAENQLKRFDPSLKLFSSDFSVEDADANAQQIIEGYSSLQKAALLASYNSLPLSAPVKALLGDVLALTKGMQAAAVTASVWQKVQAEGLVDQDLDTLLRESGLEIIDYLEPAQRKADSDIRKEESNGFVESPKDIVANAETELAAEQEDVTNNPPEPEDTPQAIPADESATGEEIPAQEPIAVASFNPATGEFAETTKPVVDKKKGNGFLNNSIIKNPDGSVTGAIDPKKLKVLNIPQLKPTAKFEGDFNPLSTPLLAIRRNGNIEVFSGRGRLQHAIDTNTPFVQVRVFGGKLSADTLLRLDALDNIKAGTASAEQCAVYYRNNTSSASTLMANGYVMTESDGTPKMASRVGMTIALHATDAEMEAIAKGAFSAQEVMNKILENLPERVAAERGTSSFALNAWHSSRVDFDRFDLSKALTGTGESYWGHGIYLTSEAALNTATVYNAAGLLNTTPSTDSIEGWHDYRKDATYKEIENLLETIKDTDETIYKAAYLAFHGEGKYRVGNPLENLIKMSEIYTEWFNDKKFLKLKRPLQALALLQNKQDKEGRYYAYTYKVKVNLNIDDLPSYSDEATESIKRKAEELTGYKSETYGEIYGAVTGKLGTKEKASKWMVENGVNGIKYKPEFLTNELKEFNKNEFNFVIYDEKYVKITKKLKRKKFTTDWREWEDFVDEQASFSLRAANPVDLLDEQFRLMGSPFSYRMLNYAKRVGNAIRKLGGDADTRNMAAAYEQVRALREYAAKNMRGIKLPRQTRELIALRMYIKAYQTGRISGAKLTKEQTDKMVADIIEEVKSMNPDDIAISDTETKNVLRDFASSLLKKMERTPAREVLRTDSRWYKMSITGEILPSMRDEVAPIIDAQVEEALFLEEQLDPELVSTKKERAKRKAALTKKYVKAYAEEKMRGIKQETKESEAEMQNIKDSLNEILKTGRIPQHQDFHPVVAEMAQDALNEYADTNNERLVLEAVKNVALDGVVNSAVKIAEGVATAIENKLKDDFVNNINKQLKGIQPVISGKKPTRARVSPETYDEITHIVELVNLTQDEVNKREDAFHAFMETEATDAEREAREKEYMLLRTWGNLAGKSLEDAWSAYYDFNSLVKTAKHAWQEKLDDEKAERDAVLDDFFSKTDAELGDDTKRKEAERRKKGILNAIKSVLDQAKSSSQFFMALSGYDSLSGLAARTMNNLANANWKIKRAEELRANKMIVSFARIMGIAGDVKNDPANPKNNMYSKKLIKHIANHEFNDFVQKILKVENTGIVRTFKNKRGETITTSDEQNRATLMNYLLMCEQEDYRENALAHGFTPDVVESIKNYLTNEEKQFAYSLRSILQGDNLAGVFKERTGVSMPDNPYYWPASLDLSRVAKKEHDSIVNNATRNGKWGMLNNRVKNNYDFAARDILSVFMGACAERNNYIYMEPVTREWRSLLSNDDFASRYRGLVGENDYITTKKWLDEMDGAGTSEGFMGFEVTNWVSRYLTGSARSLLAMSPTTLIRQLDGLMKGSLMEGVHVSDLVKQFALDQAGKGHVTYKDVLKLPAFQTRFGGQPAYAKMIQLGDNATWSKLSWLARKGMESLESLDAYTNLFSAVCLYNVTYNRLVENNNNSPKLTEREIEKMCEQKVVNMLELTAQPLRRVQKSAFVAFAHNSIIESLTFLGSELINKVGYATARAEQVYRQTGDWKQASAAYFKPLINIGIANIGLEIIIDFLRGNTPDSDDEFIDWVHYFALASAKGVVGLGYYEALPLVGNFVEAMTSNRQKGSNLVPFYDVYKEGKKCWTMLADEKRDYSFGEYMVHFTKATRGLYAGIYSIKDFNSPLRPYLSIASSLLSVSVTLQNAMYPFFQGLSNNAVWTDILPDSWEGELYKAKKKRKSKKQKDLLYQGLEFAAEAID